MPLKVGEMIKLIEADGWVPGYHQGKPPAVQAPFEIREGHYRGPSLGGTCSEDAQEYF